MKRLAFAVGVLALGLVATAPAHADYAIVKFKSDFCRIWDNTAVAPPDGHFLWWRWHHHWYYRLPTLASPITSCTRRLLGIAAIIGGKPIASLEAKPAAGHQI